MAGILPDSSQGEHIPVQHYRVWAWSLLTSLSKNWLGERAGSEPAPIASYSPQAAGEGHQATLSLPKFPYGQ